jgi:hypothetical protein
MSSVCAPRRTRAHPGAKIESECWRLRKRRRRAAGRTGAQRLRESVGRAGRIRVEVDAAGDGVPVAPIRIRRECPTATVLCSHGARRSLTRRRGDQLAVARRACSAAGAAECECCTARQALPQARGSGNPPLWKGCVHGSRTAMHAHAQRWHGRSSWTCVLMLARMQFARARATLMSYATGTVRRVESRRSRRGRRRTCQRELESQGMPNQTVCLHGCVRMRACASGRAWKLCVCE